MSEIKFLPFVTLLEEQIVPIFIYNIYCQGHHHDFERRDKVELLPIGFVGKRRKVLVISPLTATLKLERTGEKQVILQYGIKAAMLDDHMMKVQYQTLMAYPWFQPNWCFLPSDYVVEAHVNIVLGSAEKWS